MEDLAEIRRKALEKYGDLVVERVQPLFIKLLDLWEKRSIKSNHSIMEYVLALYLTDRGYDVVLEYPLRNGLICDIYASNKGRILIVEIETGFVPPANSIDPISYRRAREISKISRYSLHSDIFALATPPFHILQIPAIFLKPPEEREVDELIELKKFLDGYYKNPPVGLEELRTAKLDCIFIINVDDLSVEEYKTEDYVKAYPKWFK